MAHMMNGVMDGATDLAPPDEADLAAILQDRCAARDPVWVRGGGTRIAPRGGTVLNLSRLSGIVTYEPGEMTLIARTGTPLSQIRDMLAAEGQTLAFDPPDARAMTGLGGESTIGGVVAANASGSRRLFAGACRDHLLGVRFVDGQGRRLKNGGRVMKNVTGLDLSKLLAGSFGTLAVLTEVALKTLPAPQDQASLQFAAPTEADALSLFIAALATPFEVSGAAWHGGTAWLRIEGLPAQLTYRRDRLLALMDRRDAQVLDAAATMTLWQGLRDVTHFQERSTPLWRILVKPTDAPRIAAALRGLGGDLSLDWGGGLIWYAGPAAPDRLRAIAPHATLIRSASSDAPVFDVPVFPVPAGPVARLSQGLRRRFDPAGILNPGLMDG